MAYGDMPKCETVDQFYTLVRMLFQAHNTGPDRWRLGQTVFNVLDMVRPDLSAQVRGKAGLDPFYTTDQNAVFRFRRWLDDHWEAPT